MKKIFSILMTICLMASVLIITAVTAFAAEPAVGTVLRISAIDSDGDTVVVADHTNFEDGWNAAMELANDMEDYDYTRVVVDIYADWVANKNGLFTDDEGWEVNGPGFNNDTIYFNDDVKMTLNLNGHAINKVRNLACIRNGEVIYIDTDADVIINNGTITGGGSFNGAGGIHINSGAKVTLNNVNVVKNTVLDDDGGAIALYDGASLIMNGGSLSDNLLRHDMVTSFGGGIYAKESFVTLNNVEIKNNKSSGDNGYGSAIYADESTVVLNSCTVEGNGKEDEANNIFADISIIHAKESSITIQKSTLKDNGSLHYTESPGPQNSIEYKDVSTLIYLDDSSLIMDGCGVTKNNLGYLIHTTDNSEFFVSGVNISDNNAIVLKSTDHAIDSYFNGCTFGNNLASTYSREKYPFLRYSFTVKNPVSFYNCSMNNSTYSDPANIKIINQNLDSGVVLTISGRKADETVVKIEDHSSFETGWAAAMELATDSYWMSTNDYEYIVVDMHVDWIASNGRFTDDGINGEGFKSDTIHVSEDAFLILNMNGYKIDRGLTENVVNGEVIYIASDADIIINGGKSGDAIARADDEKATVKFGTITGGNSDTGAGGIYINDGAKVTLNNVKIVNNVADGDYGAGIAVYDGAELTMNGGGFIDNKNNTSTFLDYDALGAGIYIEDSTASFDNVLFEGNQFTYDRGAGAALYAYDSSVTMNKCKVVGNGKKNEADGTVGADSIITNEEGEMSIRETDFIGNGTVIELLDGTENCLIKNKMYLGTSQLFIDNCTFTQNNVGYIVFSASQDITVTNSRFTDNQSNVLDCNADCEACFTDCVFNNNTGMLSSDNYTFNVNGVGDSTTFINCDMGNSTYNDRNLVQIVNSGTGSIFGEGSLTMIVAFVALIASVASIIVNVTARKKETVSVTATEQAEDNE